jgi:hypothetical protein
LRVAFTVAAAISLVVGGFILRRRHQFFDADPNIDDPPAARHNRAEEIFFVWTGLTVVLLCIVYELWSA